MEQLSRPYQIALGAILVFALAYFLVLKPGDDVPADPAPAPAASAPAAPTAPGVAGLGRAVDKANGAAAQSDASAKATQDAAAAASGESTPAGSPAPAPPAPHVGDATPGTGQLEPGDASRSILDDIENRKVAVVLFYNAKGADDRAVRRALKDVPRFKGQVRVRQIPIERVADYPAITQGVPVTQAPTVLVLDKDKRARRLVGYQDTQSIQQLVGDVGGRRFRPGGEQTYLARVGTLCEDTRDETDTFSDSPDELLDTVDRGRSQFASALKRARGLEVAKGYSRFQSTFEGTLEMILRGYRAAATAERGDGTGAAVLERVAPQVDRQADVLHRLARVKGVDGC